MVYTVNHENFDYDISFLAQSELFAVPIAAAIIVFAAPWLRYR